MQQNQQLSNTSDITQWLKGVNDPDTLSHIAREVFGQIDQLQPSERDRVYSTLRNDVKFTSAVEKFQPQTA